MADKKDVADDENKERQAIWGIRKRHEIGFYTVLLIFGGWNIARLDWKDWDSFVCDAGERILASVLIVWFAYQAVDWSVFGLMSAGDFFRRQIERRKEEDRKRKEELREEGRKEAEAQIEKVRKEAEEKARKEAQKRYEDALRQLKVDPEVIQQAHHLSDALGPWRPPPR